MVLFYNTESTVSNVDVTSRGTATWGWVWRDATSITILPRISGPPKNWRWFHVFRKLGSAGRASAFEAEVRRFEPRHACHQMFSLVERATRKRKLWLADLRSSVMT